MRVAFAPLYVKHTVVMRLERMTLRLFRSIIYRLKFFRLGKLLRTDVPFTSL